MLESPEHSAHSSFITGTLDGGFGIGNSVKCGTGRIADSRFGYVILFLVFWLYPSILVKQK